MSSQNLSSMTRRSLATCLVAFATAFVSPTALSAAVLLSTANVSDRTDFTTTIGVEFQVTANTTINQLGVWEDSNGLGLSHDVGLWLPGNVTNIPDFQVTVPSGTGATLIDGFRYMPIGSDVVLTPGNNYVIGAANVGNATDAFNDPFPLGGFANGANINTVANRFGAFASAPLHYPVNSDANVVPRWAGANATFIPPVPEPSTLLLTASGLLGLGVSGRRRRVRT